MSEKRLLVIFIEGYTEEEFYKELLASLRKKNGDKFNCNIVVKNIKGIGNYKNGVTRIFEKRIKRDYKDYKYDIILCYDTDIFEFAPKPPIDWNKVVKELKNKGADTVNKVSARQSIEDWLLYDIDGLLAYLKLPKKSKHRTYAGIKGLQTLFNEASKVYIKGSKCEGLIKALDIEKILPHICEEIHVICEAIGLDCSDRKICF